eukprot:1882519-Rhodomonas_salina.2
MACISALHHTASRKRAGQAACIIKSGACQCRSRACTSDGVSSEGAGYVCGLREAVAGPGRTRLPLSTAHPGANAWGNLRTLTSCRT